MKFTINNILAILLITYCNPFYIFAQEWSEPIQISDTDGFHQYPDMCIDNSGVIHVVWSKKINYNYWKIMYSKSENDGESWNEDYDISQNDTLALLQPHIANDSVNHLYVTYDYNAQYPDQMLVYMKIFDGNQWSETMLVSEGMPGSDYNKVVIDNINRIWVFWANNGLHYYRYYNQNSWSEIMEPYFNSLPDLYSPYYIEIDSSDKMHWIGYSTEFMGAGDYAHAYFVFDFDANTWNVPINLTSNPALIGNSITLDNYYLPVVAIREKTQDTTTFDATLFMKYDGQQWSDIDLVVEDPENQQIAIDQNNKPHILDREKTITGSQMVHYQKIDDEWIGYVIDSTSYFCHPAKLLFKNNQLYLVYYRNFTPGYPDFNIMFTKYDVTTKTNDYSRPILNLSIFPNPLINCTNISFEFIESGLINLIIYDFSGKQIKTLANSNLLSGKHNFMWDGKNENGSRVESGLYLCRLYYQRNVITKSIEVIR